MTCLRVGEQAPDFALLTDMGEQWRLSAQQGRTILLVFHRHLQ